MRALPWPRWEQGRWQEHRGIRRDEMELQVPSWQPGKGDGCHRGKTPSHCSRHCRGPAPQPLSHLQVHPHAVFLILCLRSDFHQCFRVCSATPPTGARDLMSAVATLTEKYRESVDNGSSFPVPWRESSEGCLTQFLRGPAPGGASVAHSHGVLHKHPLRSLFSCSCLPCSSPAPASWDHLPHEPPVPGFLSQGWIWG